MTCTFIRKKTILRLLGFFLVLTLHSLHGLEKRAHPISMTTSILIPCHSKHQSCLEPLIEAYAYKQTVVPDEIAICISRANSKTKKCIKALLNRPWPFPIRVHTDRKAFSAGGNRNRCCQLSTGDLLICQDADDLPHPQRVEIIKFFFENYEIDHLMHAFVYSEEELMPILDEKELKWHVGEEYGIIYNIANGPVAITKEVFKKVQWSFKFIHGEDVLFNQAVYQNFPNRIVVDTPLYVYRRGYMK